MVILGIETSASAASCALCDETGLLGEFFINTKQTHSQTLMPMTKALLDNTQLRTEDIDVFAVACGPGSFTGLRIGIAAVKGMAMAHGTPCAAVSTLKALAYNMRGAQGLVCAAMDARCKQVYTALFRANGGAVERLTDDSALTLDELDRQLSQLDAPIFLVGDGARLCYNNLDKQRLRLCLAPEHLLYQRAASVCALGRESMLRGEVCGAQSLIPAYLRLPQAQRELLARQDGAFQVR